MSFQLNWHGDEILRKIKSAEGDVTLSELFPDSFVRQNTDFQTLQEMFDASGVKNPEDINSEAFSTFIAARTRFDSWKDMQLAAFAERIRRKLKE